MSSSERSHRGLFATVDPASLAIFRIGFGAALLWGVARTLLYGRVAAHYIEPPFHFTYHGFAWVRPLPGGGMYVTQWLGTGFEGTVSTYSFPADTLFIPRRRSKFDGIVAMYHDQGLIPVKMLAFDTAVNVTLGLPIIRTSVDHGTAFDIAGTNQADPGSMIEAIRLACHLATRTKKPRKAPTPTVARPLES